MNRRGFLSAMLAAASAPAIVRAESLMRIVIPEKKIVLPDEGIWVWSEPVFYTMEPGSYSGHDWLMGAGGPRFDRVASPSIAAEYLAKM